METIKVENEFVEYIREHITDRLTELDGLCSYGCDMAFELTLQENNNGLTHSDAEAIEFIGKYPKAGLATIDYLNWHFGSDEITHAMKTWQTFTFFMLYFGVNSMFNSLPYVEEHWDDEIELDKETTRILIEQVKTAGIEY